MFKHGNCIEWKWHDFYHAMNLFSFQCFLHGMAWHGIASNRFIIRKLACVFVYLLFDLHAVYCNLKCVWPFFIVLAFIKWQGEKNKWKKRRKKMRRICSAQSAWRKKDAQISLFYQQSVNTKEDDSINLTI